MAGDMVSGIQKDETFQEGCGYHPGREGMSSQWDLAEHRIGYEET